MTFLEFYGIITEKLSELEVNTLSGSLKSFSFGVYKGYSDIPASVWSLFTEMGESPTKSFPYVDEILTACLEGRIATNVPFNFEGYCKAIEMNTRLACNSRAKKVFAYTEDDNIEDDGITYGTISLNRVSLVAKMENYFDKLEDDDELLYAVSQIRSLNETFILEYSVNILETLRNAVRGIPSAVDKLRSLCDEFSDVAEYVKVILSSGKDLDECFA